ncbi:MAG: DNA alkylation repair protein [Bacteroidales bacterium]|nr:DNA alkylation repair protein [Bacteroidales bacterium]MCF8457290.1 DNA alkylation repair protein [Bacteroidales bacterium]
MTLDEVMKELESYGNEQTKKVLVKHGAKEPFFGVRVQDLKKIVKKIKKDHELSLELYATGNSDAMYLAGLIADADKISKEDLRRWANEAYWYYLSEFAVPWIAAETKYGFELGLEWIESEDERIAACGWATLSSCASVKPDSDLDIAKYKELLDRAQNTLHASQNRVRHTMNAFVIAVGSYIKELTAKSMEVAGKIGKVKVDMGGTACKVPLATEYIQKVADRGAIGKKRTAARC